MLTPEQVRKAFQDAMPARRDAFAVQVRACHYRLTHSDDQFVLRYPREVLALAESELRSRNDIAADRVKALLESGWTPPKTTTIVGVFLDMFSGYEDWQKNASTDLFERVEAAFSEVGRHDPIEQAAHSRRLGVIQSQTAQACMSDLECYQVKKPQHQSITVSNSGTVGALQVGDANVAHVSQNISSELKVVTEALDIVRAQLPTLRDSDLREEIETYVVAIEGEVEKPSPKLAPMKTWLKNIGRVAGVAAEWTGKTLVETAVSAAIRGITHS